MIILNLWRIVHQKGISRPFTALRQLKISHKMASYYLNGHYKMLKLADIEKICLAWHCTPNDLLQWNQSATDIKLPDTHPLNELVRPETMANVSELLINASPEKLKEVQRILIGD